MAVIDFGGATLPYGTTLPLGATNYNMGAAPTATGDSTFSNTNDLISADVAGLYYHYYRNAQYVETMPALYIFYCYYLYYIISYSRLAGY